MEGLSNSRESWEDRGRVLIMQWRRIPGGKVGTCPPWKKRWARLSFCPPTYERSPFWYRIPHQMICIHQAIFSGDVTPVPRTRSGIATPCSIMSVYNIGSISGPIMEVWNCTSADREGHLRDKGGPHADKEALWQTWETLLPTNEAL